MPTREGFVLLAVVLDVLRRKIAGWAMSSRQRVTLVQAALTVASDTRGARGVVLHFDQGIQHTALAFTRLCLAAGIERSMSAAGDCYDNAMAESSWHPGMRAAATSPVRDPRACRAAALPLPGVVL